MGKFGGLLNRPEQVAETDVDAKPHSHEPKQPPAPVTSEVRQATSPEPGPKKMGRPTGKRATVKTIQVSAYIEENTHIQAKMKLLRERGKTGTRLDFSGLIQQLLSEWIAS